MTSLTMFPRFYSSFGLSLKHCKLIMPRHLSQIPLFPHQRRCGPSLSALKSSRKSSNYTEVDDVDKEEEEEDLESLPFGDMKKWFENKPSGFGEGKIYDTSTEESLLKEIEQSRKAQLVNINLLRSGSVQRSRNKDKGVSKGG